MALVRELRGGSPMILVVEDLHWADEATLDVLKLVGRRIESVPALLILTYRDDELDRGHPLRLLLGELHGGEEVARLLLDRLSPSAVAELARSRGVDPDELYRKTEGNPFFVTEVLASGESLIPDTVRDAVLARAARLSSGARRLLEAVAIVPDQVETWLLELLAPEPLADLSECLDSGMLVAGREDVAFRHQLARLAVEESLDPVRRRELNRRALAALADPPAGRPDVTRLAHHAEAAADSAATLEHATAAGRLASSRGITSRRRPVPGGALNQRLYKYRLMQTPGVRMCNERFLLRFRFPDDAVTPSWRVCACRFPGVDEKDEAARGFLTRRAKAARRKASRRGPQSSRHSPSGPSWRWHTPPRPSCP